jgi:hypothetical protein
VLVTDRPRYNLRTDNDFSLDKYRTDLRKRCISITGPDMWHSLPISLRSVRSISSFKKSVLCHLTDNC